MPTPPATAYETDVKTLRKRVNYLRTENEALHAEIDRLQGALMVLHTWATVDNVLVTRHVVDLCERHLGMMGSASCWIRLLREEGMMRTLQDAWQAVHAAREAIAQSYLKPDAATEDLLAMAEALERLGTDAQQAAAALKAAKRYGAGCWDELVARLEDVTPNAKLD